MRSKWGRAAFFLFGFVLGVAFSFVLMVVTANRPAIRPAAKIAAEQKQTGEVSATPHPPIPKANGLDAQKAQDEDASNVPSLYEQCFHRTLIDLHQLWQIYESQGLEPHLKDFVAGAIDVKVTDLHHYFSKVTDQKGINRIIFILDRSEPFLLQVEADLRGKALARYKALGLDVDPKVQARMSSNYDFLRDWRKEIRGKETKGDF